MQNSVYHPFGVLDRASPGQTLPPLADFLARGTSTLDRKEISREYYVHTNSRHMANEIERESGGKYKSSSLNLSHNKTDQVQCL